MSSQDSNTATCAKSVGGHAPEVDLSVLVSGNNKVSIKPFATLDDALFAAAKVSRLVYPEFAGEDANDLNYASSLIRAVSNLNVVPENERYDALVGVLAVVLMGFDPTDVEGIKESLAETLAKLAQKQVNEQTKNFLKDSGFTHDLS